MGLAHWDAVMKSHGRVIIAIWHESMGLSACHFRGSGYHTLTSYSFDGEMAARVVRRFGMLAVRGSSSRGGAEAVRSLAAALEHVPAVGFTLDGPKGPRRVAKAGVAVLAARTQTPIIPFAITVAPSWRLNSWDRLPVPKPFSRIVSAFGPAVVAPGDDSEEKVEEVRAQIEASLNELHADLDRELGVTI